MSDHFVHVCNGCDGKSGESLHSYHSVWMSHWTPRSCGNVIMNRNCLSTSFGNKKNGDAANDYLLSRGKEIVSSSCDPAKGASEIETGILKFRSESLRMISMTNGTEKCVIDHEDDRIPMLPLLNDKPSPAYEEQLPHTDLSDLEREHLDYWRPSTFLSCEEKVERHSQSVRSLTSYRLQNKALLFQMDPCTSNNYSPISGGQQIQKAQNFSGIRLFQNQFNLPETTKSEKLFHGCNSLPKFPHSLQDVETMRMCPTVDSAAPLCGGHPRFSQTAQSLLISKATDLHSYKENQTFTSSRESSRFEGNSFINLKALGNSKDRRGKKVVDDYELKNESSAERDTMDLDDFKENQLSGVNSSPSDEDLRMDFATHQVIMNSTREVEHRQRSTELPDSNLELPALPFSDNMDPSSSKTQNLDMQALVAHAEQLSHSESDGCVGCSAKPEPSSRWIKRLRSSALESLGTKSSNIGEESCHEKSNLSLGKCLKSSTDNSQSTVSKLHGKELMVLDNTAALGRYLEDTTNKGKVGLTSQSWIRRWSRGQSAMQQKKSDIMVVCEPQSSKLAFENLQEKQLPSIAAVGGMGKAMNRFQPCEFQRRGSFIVWNTRSF